MKEFYTVADLMQFPGLANHKIKAVCGELKLKRKKQKIHGRMLLAFNRKDFERLLKHFEFEKVKMKGQYFWVKICIPDF